MCGVVLCSDGEDQITVVTGGQQGEGLVVAAVVVIVTMRRNPDVDLAEKVCETLVIIIFSFALYFTDRAAIPPPSSLSSGSTKPPEKNEEKDGLFQINLIQCVTRFFFNIIVVHSALEELSKKKAEKTGPFSRPKMYVCMYIGSHHNLDGYFINTVLL